jgi:hypothetical protein
MEKFRAMQVMKVAVQRSKEERRRIERQSRMTSPVHFSFGKPLPQLLDSIDSVASSALTTAQYGRLWRKTLTQDVASSKQHEQIALSVLKTMQSQVRRSTDMQKMT